MIVINRIDYCYIVSSTLTEAQLVDLGPSLNRTGVSFNSVKIMANSNLLIPSRHIELTACIGEGNH